MFKAICESTFHYYPFLSDMTPVVLAQDIGDRGLTVRMCQVVKYSGWESHRVR